MAATALAIAATAGLALSHEFDTHWYFAVLGGVGAYIVALVLFALSVGRLSAGWDDSSRETLPRNARGD